MVKEEQVEDLPATQYVTDNDKFIIKAKAFTLEKFETKLCKDKIKGNPQLRSQLIDRWIMFRTKPKDRELIFTREELINAWDEMKAYIFKAYAV